MPILSSQMESDSGSVVDGKKPKNTRLFSAAQRSCLNTYYESGMRGTGEQFRDLHVHVHNQCAKESGLSVIQVTVSNRARGQERMKMCECSILSHTFNRGG